MAMSIPKMWAEQSRYDLDTAKAMFEAGRYIYVLFCCQQALEKAFKGLIAKRTGETPKRTHNLTQLTGDAGVKLTESQILLLARLTEYYVKTRYPEEFETTAAVVWKPIAESTLVQTEEMNKWLLSML